MHVYGYLLYVCHSGATFCILDVELFVENKFRKHLPEDRNHRTQNTLVGCT